MTLELQAFTYLRHERRCPIVLYERSPRQIIHNDRPDVMGVTSARFLIEIEAKRTFADFAANAEKRHVTNRPMLLSRWPKQFYFIVPEKLAARVLPALPEWAGLLVSDHRALPRVARDAPVNHSSRKLTVKQALRIVHLQSNQVWAAELRLYHARDRFECASHPPEIEWMI